MTGKAPTPEPRPASQTAAEESPNSAWPHCPHEMDPRALSTSVHEHSRSTPPHSSQQGTAATILRREMLGLETWGAGQGKHREPAPAAPGRVRACSCGRNLSLAAATPLFSFRKCHQLWATGREGKLAEPKSAALSVGTSVRVPFAKLPPGLPELQERRDFPRVDGAAGLCPRGGRSGSANGTQVTGASSPDKGFLSAEGSGPAVGKTGLCRGGAGIRSERDGQRRADQSDKRDRQTSKPTQELRTTRARREGPGRLRLSSLRQPQQ